MTNFKDYPKSVGDVRSDKTGSAADWSPRDALIQVLRDIDRGEISPDVMVICYTSTSDGAQESAVVSSPNVYNTVGLLACCLHRRCGA